ncbi:MAG TPA: hypothetical protein VGT04_03105 [Acidobacteriaceae bacterium]|nr:hypothetical protein [Acidobacteriaceae bacterium]
MRFKSGAKPQTTGQFTPKARGPEPKIEHEMPAQEHPVSVQPVEPADPRKTGSSKPEQRKHLKQNVEGETAAKPHPETVPGQHATGSFTDKKRRAS